MKYSIIATMALFSTSMCVPSLYSLSEQEGQEYMASALLGRNRDNSHKGIACKGPQGPAGAPGAAGPAGPAGAAGAAGSLFTDFGYFTNIKGAPVLSLKAVPFDLQGAHTATVELVTDITFAPGDSAVALTQPGTYVVTVLVSTPLSAGEFALSLNGSIDANTKFSSSAFTSFQTYISVDQANLSQGQNGAALLKLINTDGGAVVISNRGGCIATSINVLKISSQSSEP